MAGAIFQYILIFFRPHLDFYRSDFRGLGGESPVATVYFFSLKTSMVKPVTQRFLLF